MAFKRLKPNDRDKNAGKRDKRTADADQFSLKDIWQHFDDSIEEIKNLFGAVNYIQDTRGRTAEKVNIWRAQVVFLSSALDFYMHELTQYGLCEIFDGVWEMTDEYKNLAINMGILEESLKKQEKDFEWFCRYITKSYGETPMASLGAITRQLELLGISMEDVAAKAYPRKEIPIGKKIAELKYTLWTQNERRNIIVHQSNREHENPEIRNSVENITQQQVSGYIYAIKNIVKAINEEAEMLRKKKKEKDAAALNNNPGK